jgi:hypothetical protein
MRMNSKLVSSGNVSGHGLSSLPRCKVRELLRDWHSFPGGHMLRSRSITLAVQYAALFLFGGSAAQAATVAGTADITGASNLPNLQFSDTSSPVLINQFAAVSSTNNTVLGIVNVTGADNGTFTLYELGQVTHSNDARFHFSEVITNSAAFDQQFQMNFLINAGMLQTRVYETVPPAGQYLNSGYEITISFGGTTLFSSSALLDQVRASDTTTTATLTQNGTSLGGVLDHYELGAPDSWQYAWNAYSGVLNLGLLAAGASATLEYDARVFGQGNCSYSCGSTTASIGDPSHVSSIGGPGTIIASPGAVPEPETYAMLLGGLGLLGWVGRRRKQKAA